MNRGATRNIAGVLAMGIALAVYSMDISPHRQDGQAAWRASLVSPAYAEEEFVAVLIRVIEGVTSQSGPSQPGSSQSNQSGSSLHLGMYVPSDVPGQPGLGSAFGMWGGGYLATGGPYIEKDLVKGVTKSPSQRDTFSLGGIYGLYDASRFLPANQSLTFYGTVGIAQDNLTFGPLSGQSVSAGYNKFGPLYIVSGYAKWSIGSLYLQGLGIALLGDGSQYSIVTRGFGSYRASDYAVDAKLGNVFVLYRSGSVIPSATLPTKAASRGDNGYMLGLDLSGHAGYNDVLINGFTDTASFIWGNTEAKFAMVGATAKLFATIPAGYWFQWKPYVSAAVDYYPGLSIDRMFPRQPLLPTGDIETILLAPTFWTGELGLDLQNDAGWTVGMKGFYMASSDTIIRYAGAYLKIPFNAPLGATRY